MFLQVRDKMERQGVQVKKLEANHAHLINRNNFRVLIFQVRVTSEVRGALSPCWSEVLVQVQDFRIDDMD